MGEKDQVTTRSLPLRRWVWSQGHESDDGVELVHVCAYACHLSRAFLFSRLKVRLASFQGPRPAFVACSTASDKSCAGFGNEAKVR